MPTRRVADLLLVLTCVLLLPGLGGADEGLRQRVEQLRAAGNAQVAGARLADGRVLDDFYAARGYRLAWADRRRAETLARLAELSSEDGLDPRDFHDKALRELLAGPGLDRLSGRARADADVLLSEILLRLIHHYRYGKVDPQALDSTWNHAEGPYASDLVRDLVRVVEADDLEFELRSLTPRPVFYLRLKAGLARYREIAAAGGWQPVPPGRTLSPRMRDRRVPAIRARLRLSGDFLGSDPADARLYDAPLKEAVTRFQQRHNLGVDGVIGPATLAAMNVPAEARVDQIRVNLERMRWVYDELPGDYLLVDVAGQRVALFRDSEAVWQSRVIVGRPDRPTPVFRDQIEYLEFNPTWTVPPTILKEDILPNARKNPGYVTKKGLEVVTRDGRKVSLGSVNWHVSAGSFPYMLRQPPGEKNALGLVKFMFPNRFSVYLHDTPGRDLFDKPQRLHSSGCVRVENPMELAELVLNEPGRWNQEKFRAVVASGRTRWVHLKKPLPIILAYWTAEAGEDGQVRFREDVYQRDAQVLAALNGDGPLRLVYVPEPSREPVAAPGGIGAGSSPDPRTTANGLSHPPPAMGL